MSNLELTYIHVFYDFMYSAIDVKQLGRFYINDICSH
jgi:hypothetical protein